MITNSKKKKHTILIFSLAPLIFLLCSLTFANNLSDVFNAGELMQPVTQEIEECGVKGHVTRQHEICGEIYNKKAAFPCAPKKFKKGTNGELCGWEDSFQISHEVCLTGTPLAIGGLQGVENAPVSPEKCNTQLEPIPKTCRHKEFGVQEYKACRHPNFGREAYKTCSHPSFPKIFHKCNIAMTRSQLNSYLQFLQNTIEAKKNEFLDNQTSYYYSLRMRHEHYCLIKQYLPIPFVGQNVDGLINDYQTLYGQPFDQNLDFPCDEKPSYVISDQNGKSCEDYTLPELHSIESTIDGIDTGDGFFKSVCQTWKNMQFARHWFAFQELQIEILLNDKVPSQEPDYQDSLSNYWETIEEFKQAFPRR